jgi:hypothetical protein
MVRLPDETFHSYRCEPPSLEVEVTKDQLVDMYQNMVSGRVVSSNRARGSWGIITCGPLPV